MSSPSAAAHPLDLFTKKNELAYYGNTNVYTCNVYNTNKGGASSVSERRDEEEKDSTEPSTTPVPCKRARLDCIDRLDRIDRLDSIDRIGSIDSIRIGSIRIDRIRGDARPIDDAQRRSFTDRFLSLKHSAACGCSGVGPASCSLGPRCVAGQKLLGHIMLCECDECDGCDGRPTCAYGGCTESARALAHYRGCTDVGCKLCGSVGTYGALVGLADELPHVHRCADAACPRRKKLADDVLAVARGADDGEARGRVFRHMADIYTAHLHKCTDAACLVPRCLSLKARIRASMARGRAAAAP